MATIDTIRTYFENILQRSGSEVTTAELQSYASAVDSGALTLAQARAALINSPEGQDVQDVVRLYQTVFGRVPDKAGLNFQVDALRGPATELNLANGFAASPEFAARFGGNTVNTAFINAVYQQVLGRAPAASEVQFYLDSGFSAGRIALAFSEAPEFRRSIDNAVANFLDAAGQGTATYTGSLGGNVISGVTLSLTTGADALVGTSANDLFIAADVTSGGVASSTLTVGDTIDGGAGTDTLNITQTAAFNGLPTGAAVTNVENVNILSGGTIALNTTTGFADLTALKSVAVGGTTITAAATTAITASSTGAAGGNEPITVNGGSTVTVSALNNVGDAVSVGGTTAATGAVIVNSTGGTTNLNAAGNITVTGGTTVTVNQVAGNVAATGNNTVGGDITVTGNASTTAVTVNQSATATGATATATAAGKIGFAAGDVTVTDANAASTTAAGTIATVTLTNFDAATVNSGALKTLNLSGTGASVNASTLGALTTPANTSLAVNLNGLTTTGAVQIDSDITALNIASSTNASKLNSLTANGVTTLNVSGDAKVEFTAQTLNAVTSIVSTNTAGVTLGSALGTAVTFTGAAGADSIVLTDEFTKAITLGAGNDKVAIADTNANGTLAGTGGSVVAGDGIDTIALTAATAAAISTTPTFNSKFSGFEVADITATTADATVNVAGINGVNQVVARGIGAGNELTLTGLASGATLTLDTAAAGSTSVYTLEINNALVSATDVANVVLSNSTGGAITTFGTVKAVGVETINISTVDAGTGANTAATIDALTLEAANATKIVVAGNNGLTLTNTGNTAVTSFDASGVVGNSSDDTAANLGVTFTSANTTASAAVTIIGGAGSDALTGNAGVDTITGGLGADRISGAGGNDIINLTEASPSADTVVILATADNGIDTITGFSAGTSGLDIVEVRVGATTATTTTGNVAEFAESTNTTLTTGASAFALTGASTTTSDVVEINATLSSFGNLGATGVVDGTELLKALSSVNVASSGITTTASGDDFYLVAYQNNNAYLYQVTNGADTNVTASEIALVGVFNGVAQGAFASGDFTVAT